MAKKETQTGVRFYSIPLPLLKGDRNGYLQRNLTITRLSYAQAETLKSLVVGLQKIKAKLKHGDKLVDSPVSAIRWILENIDSTKIKN